jgi:hypothetical protein
MLPTKSPCQRLPKSATETAIGRHLDPQARPDIKKDFKNHSLFVQVPRGMEIDLLLVARERSDKGGANVPC